jgi:hypothetical protein
MQAVGFGAHGNSKANPTYTQHSPIAVLLRGMLLFELMVMGREGEIWLVGREEGWGFTEGEIHFWSRVLAH